MGSLPKQDRETNDEYQARLKAEKAEREKLQGSQPGQAKPAAKAPTPVEEPPTSTGKLASNKPQTPPNRGRA